MRRASRVRATSLIAWATGLGLVFCARTAAATTSSSECAEVSTVVGEQQCGRYGSTWSIERLPPAFVRLGLRAAQMLPDGMEFSGHFGKERRHEYSYPGEAVGVSSLRALGFDVGMAGFISGQPRIPSR